MPSRMPAIPRRFTPSGRSFFAAMAVLAAAAACPPARSAPAPSKPPAAKPAAPSTAAQAGRPAAPSTAKPAARSAASLLPGIRFLPPAPMAIAAVQPAAVDRFLSMMSGGAEREASTADVMTGLMQLLKDQIDGPIAFAAYADDTGRPGSFVMAARLMQAALTRELINGALTMGGDGSSAPKSSAYRGQTLMTFDLPKETASRVPVPLQPTLSLTGSDFLLVGATPDIVRKAIDAGEAPNSSSPAQSLSGRTDVAAALRDFPPGPDTDVWLFLPKPSGKTVSALKLPAPLNTLPLGSAVTVLRFTAAGVRFEGLATVERTSPPTPPRRGEGSPIRE